MVINHLLTGMILQAWRIFSKKNIMHNHSKISPTYGVPLEDGPPEFLTNSFCLGISFELWGWKGKSGVFSEGMWAKSLNRGFHEKSFLGQYQTTKQQTTNNELYTLFSKKMIIEEWIL